jgi:hypothetical protein
LNSISVILILQDQELLPVKETYFNLLGKWKWSINYLSVKC